MSVSKPVLAHEYADAAVRKRLSEMCGGRRTREARRQGQSWRPTELRHPTTGDHMVDDQAWDLIRAAIDRGDLVEVVTLVNFKSQTAYELKIAGHGDTIIYVKLRFLERTVQGMSFHRDGKDDK